MTRRMKGIGLTFLAISAISMVSATGVQGSELHANVNGNVSIFGNQTAEQHVLTTNSGSARCNQSFFEATATKAQGATQVTAQDVTATPTYTGECLAFGQAATIDMNGCKYTLTGEGNPSLTANVDLRCSSLAPPSGVSGTDKGVEITTAICRMTVPAQNNLTHLVFANNATQDVTVRVTVAGITYQADGPLCPNMPTGQTATNGIYSGQATFQATEDKGSGQAVSHNGHQYAPLAQNGAPVPLQGT